jgi:hypothetical protein
MSAVILDADQGTNATHFELNFDNEFPEEKSVLS